MVKVWFWWEMLYLGGQFCFHVCLLLSESVLICVIQVNWEAELCRLVNVITSQPFSRIF